MQYQHYIENLIVLLVSNLLNGELELLNGELGLLNGELELLNGELELLSGELELLNRELELLNGELELLNRELELYAVYVIVLQNCTGKLFLEPRILYILWYMQLP